MDDQAFLDGLKTDEDKTVEFIASAEHLVRLRQLGESAPAPEPLPVEKTAFTLPELGLGAATVTGAGVAGGVKDKKVTTGLGTAAGAAAGGIGALRLQLLLDKKDKLPRKVPTGTMGALAGGYGAYRLLRRKKEKTASDGPVAVAFNKLKTAGIIDTIKNPYIAVPAAAGALIGGAATYMGSKPRKNLEGRSNSEDDAGNMVRLQNMKGEQDAGFLEKLKNRSTEAAHGYAKAFREHPVKATALGGALGALSGATTARILLGGKKL